MPTKFVAIRSILYGATPFHVLIILKDSKDTQTRNRLNILCGTKPNMKLPDASNNTNIYR